MSMLDAVERVKTVYSNIADAALRAGRNPSEIAMLAVSKDQPLALMQELALIKVVTFGESRIQEAIPKIAHFIDDIDVSFHFIGRLQGNKAKQAVDNFVLIHSVDRISLASELQKYASRRESVQEILLQVNLAGEEQKGGILEEGLPELYEATMGMPFLKIRGFMMIPPLDEEPKHNRGLFRRMREIFEVYKAQNNAIDILSMGMSHDYAIAVEEGANLVRIGMALFGKR